MCPSVFDGREVWLMGPYLSLVLRIGFKSRRQKRAELLPAYTLNTVSWCFMPCYNGNDVDVDEGEDGTNKARYDCRKAE